MSSVVRLRNFDIIWVSLQVKSEIFLFKNIYWETLFPNTIVNIYAFCPYDLSLRWERQMIHKKKKISYTYTVFAQFRVKRETQVFQGGRLGKILLRR